MILFVIKCHTYKIIDIIPPLSVLSILVIINIIEKEKSFFICLQNKGVFLNGECLYNMNIHYYVLLCMFLEFTLKTWWLIKTKRSILIENLRIFFAHGECLQNMDIHQTENECKNFEKNLYFIVSTFSSLVEDSLTSFLVFIFSKLFILFPLIFLLQLGHYIPVSAGRNVVIEVLQ